MLVAGSAFAATSNTNDGAVVSKKDKRIVIRVASDLCDFDRELPRRLIRKLRRLKNYDELVAYMLTNCPALGLPLVDTPTASIVATHIGDGEDGNSGSGGPGRTGGSGGPGSGAGGSGGYVDDGPDDSGNDNSGGYVDDGPGETGGGAGPGGAENDAGDDDDDNDDGYENDRD